VQAYDPKAVHLPRFSPATVRKVALASVICYALLVVSGGGGATNGVRTRLPGLALLFSNTT